MIQGISSYAMSPLLNAAKAADGPAQTTDQAADTAANKTPDKAANGLQLDEHEQREVERLKARDRERGPDGVSYATGGEVGIDTSAGRTPEETLQRARIIRAAAMAPAEPSGQDRAVAAKAAQMETQARAEMAQQDDQDDTQGDSRQFKPEQGAGLPGYSDTEHRSPGRQLDIHA